MSTHYYEARRTNSGGIIGVVYHYEYQRLVGSVGRIIYETRREVFDYNTDWLDAYPASQLTEQEAIDLARLWCQDNSIQAERGVPLSEQSGADSDEI